MKYIEKVILENFQSHKSSIIEFDDQLNVIVGPSDSGKTAILRGIRWALYNEPSGDYFIREGTGECSVTVIFNDGTKIKRYRNKSKNIYFLYDSNNNETKFEGFGTSVPQEIIDETGIKKILLDSDLSNAINLSDQLEGAFLLSERASTRASSIGRLVGVNIIDDALRESLKDSRNLSNNKKNTEDNVFQLEKELSEYNYLDELANRISYIEKIKDEIQEKNKTICKYQDLLNKFLTISQEKKELSFYMKKLESINLVDNVLNLISSDINKFNYLNKQFNSMNKLALNKNENAKIITSLKSIDKVENNIAKMISSYDLRIKLIDCKSKLGNIQYEMDGLKIISSNLSNLNILQNNINMISNSIIELKKLSDIKDKELSLRKSLAIGIRYVEKLQEIDYISKIHMDLQKRIVLLNQLKNLHVSYNSNKDEIKKLNILLQRYKDEVDKQLLYYKELLLKQEICPLCFSIIDNDKINHIISHYN
ncbi:AAA family ATPase [Tissierella carlieri]|jgi:exonuclease SbcC|uniref:AAA family ATPase n=1 Tax=Tissierella carlieri TaxID=689904 RepID=UPI002804E6F2|nr:AAA family ATPase [uncultured Tissierella sp.]MDU5079939.1 AAA family ATPase [Bacillota bacterium]